MNMGHRIRLLIVLISLSLCALSQAGDPHYYQQVEPGEPKVIACDVLVYGGTPAGVAAAIQAGDMDKKVLLLSFNHHVGGLTSGGLTGIIYVICGHRCNLCFP